MPVPIYIYLASVLIAFLSSLTSFRLDLPFHLKLFSCLLGLTLLVELTASILVFGYHRSNRWLYNGFMLVEFSTYAYYYLRIIPSRKLKKILQAFLLIFPIFWGIVEIKTGFYAWNGFVVTVGSFFSVLFALMYYYRIITTPEIMVLRTLPEFWIATGMVIFYLGSFSFFGMLNFINKYPKVAVRLLDVYEILDIVMYALFSYGFLCRIINTKKSSSF
ncbi:MAG TPA: hypothetical protein VK518_23685 [Puia sp.]|nr:hypothetical protein [Puia sp.]